MTWIANSRLPDVTTTMPTLSQTSSNKEAEHWALLAKGSLVFDFNFSLGQKAPCKILEYSSTNGWQRKFTIFLNADHTLSIQVIQGENSSYAHLAQLDLKEVENIRVTFSWSAPARFGVLTAENSGDGSIHQTKISNPIPLPKIDAVAIAQCAPDVLVDERLRDIALSDQISPIGPSATICAGAAVETTQGYRAIERLGIGDLVHTKDNGYQPVRWIVRHEKPTIGGTAPMKLRAPFFGLINDIVVAQDQRVLISGAETEYSLGHDAALIEAHSLVGHPAVAMVTGALHSDFYQVLLDRHECICVSGAWTDSLYIGHLKQSPEILPFTGISDIPTSVLPTHRGRTRPLLHDYERQALLDTLTA